MVSIIKLQTKDQEIFEVDVKLLQHSQLISSILDHGDADKDHQIPFPLEKVNGTIFRKVLQWGEHHDNNPIPYDNEASDDWDSEFMRENTDIIYELMEASNYLAMEKLLNLIYESYAITIKEQGSGDHSALCVKAEEIFAAAMQKRQLAEKKE